MIAIRLGLLIGGEIILEIGAPLKITRALDINSFHYLS
jgi:hypothetical protein